MQNSSTSPLSAEEALIRQLAAIEIKIAELEAEKKAVQRILSRIRSENLNNKDVTRSNSFSRILIENKVMEIFGEESREIDTKILYQAAKSQEPGLKESTFRSHLHRMKEKGLIEPTGRRGSWKISEIKK